ATGVDSANSILLVTFAREQQLKGRSALRAALDAGKTRIRPVLMTAAAMVAGIIPLGIGGPSGGQNAAVGARRRRVFAPSPPAHRPVSVCHAAQTQRRRRGLWRIRGAPQ